MRGTWPSGTIVVGRRRVHLLGLPALWLVLGLFVVGGWQIGGMIRQALAAYPVPALAAMLVFGLYAVPFVLVVRGVDFLEQEPPALIAVAFCWGGVVATSQAIPANAAVRNILASLYSPSFADTWSPAISAPVVEEVLKALGVVAIVLLAIQHINSVLDGFVYGSMVGLGFQVVEDFVYAVNAIHQANLAGSDDWVSPLMATFLARGFLSGLWSHTMFTALAGAGIAYAVVRRHHSRFRRFGIAVLAFVGAWGFHFVWDTPWLFDGFGLGVEGVLAAVVIKGLPGLVVVLLLARAALQQEAAYYTQLLRSVSDISLVTPQEISVLVKGRNRIAARRAARSRYGWRGALAVRRLQRAQARFAVALGRYVDGAGGPDDARQVAVLRRREDDVRRARQRLNALGIDRIEVPEPVPHTVIGALAIGFGLMGVAVPQLFVVSVAVAGIGLYRARRRREVPDSWFGDGLLISAIGIALWLLSYLIAGSLGD